MDYRALAELLYPNITTELSDLEERFPIRPLAAGARVTRLGPSPTGFMHIGNLYGALIDERLAHQSNGVFFLRIEDTDDKRRVEGAEEVIHQAFNYFSLSLDEGILSQGEVGNYGPYRQSERKEIYQIVAKHLVTKGYAYPSFITPEELEQLRTKQEAEKVDPGYYGKWATERHLTIDQIKKELAAGKPWTLRLKSRALVSSGDIVADGIRGHVTVHPNVQDIVLLKTNGLPTYHFAHVVDDHFMRVTHVVRGEEWLATLPVHLELFDLLEWNRPIYCHNAHLMKQENGTRRKLSKRKDPEMSLSYYMEKGYHPDSVREYLMILINSDYEEWRRANPNLFYAEFEVTLEKMATSGALYDLAKLNDVAKETLLQISEEKLAHFLLNWSSQYQPEVYDLIREEIKAVEQLLAIGRNDKKPRKDLIYAEQIWQHISYYFDSYFIIQDDLPENVSLTQAAKILEAYLAVFSETDDKSTWFNKVKAVAVDFNYAEKPKEFKKNPEAYAGHVGDIAGLIRLALTGRENSPDLWSVQQVFGEKRVRDRIKAFIDDLEIKNKG